MSNKSFFIPVSTFLIGCNNDTACRTGGVFSMKTEMIYSYSWLKSGGKGSLIRRLLSSMMKISTYALAGGMYVSASSWQDAPQGPPYFILS